MTARLVTVGAGLPRDVVVCFHVGAHMDAAIAAAARGAAVLNWTFSPPAGKAASGQYKPRSQGGGLPSSCAELRATAVELLPGVELGSLLFAGWSEGCQGARTFLQLGATPAGIVACDGIHAPLGASVTSPSLAPWRAYADQARAGKVYLAVTATSIDPQTYLATSATLPLVTGFTSADWRSEPQGFRWALVGRLYGEQWPGQNAAAHVAQQRAVLPRLLDNLRRQQGAAAGAGVVLPASRPPSSRTAPAPAAAPGVSSGAALGALALFFGLGAVVAKWRN